MSAQQLFGACSLSRIPYRPQTTPVDSVDALSKHLKGKAGRALYGVPNSGAQLMGEAYKAMATDGVPERPSDHGGDGRQG